MSQFDPRCPAGAIAAVLLAMGCGESGTGPPPPLGDTLPVELERVLEGLDRPLFLTAPPGDPRLFLVEQGGRIRIARDGALVEEPFLDLSSLVTGGNEQGLLGLAFHPDFTTNGRFFVDYTDVGGDTRVVEFRSDPTADVADPDSERLVLSVTQPFSNHNGGQVSFGPDGMLFIGLGDGGSAGDPGGNGQDLSTLLGTLLRIDVDGALPYAIPADNPFTGTPGARPEIWAYGLRNPWRFSFDGPSALLFISDVGQNQWEEVNAAPAVEGGLNYGWATVEGPACFRGGSCDRSGLRAPALVYDHGDGCSVTGGHVYRGTSAPSLVGMYLFADFCSGWVRAAELDGGGLGMVHPLDVPRPGSVSSFGTDGLGESYLLTLEGEVFQFVEG